MSVCIKKPTTENPPNEFLPSAGISLYCPAFIVRNILVITKIDPTKNYSVEIDDLKYSYRLEFIEITCNNYLNPGANTRVENNSSRYGAVSHGKRS